MSIETDIAAIQRGGNPPYSCTAALGAALLAGRWIAGHRFLPQAASICLFLMLIVSRAEAEQHPAGIRASDLADIRALVEQRRYAVNAVDGEHRARNPGQAWTVRFDGRGFDTTPDDRDWTWGLELARYGWGEELCEVSAPIAVLACGGDLAYAWDDALTEWYRNGVVGLEHGYTIHARPTQAPSALMLDVGVRGGLTPVVSKCGRNVRFDTHDCAAVVYDGLKVFDATGRSLDARWSIKNSGELRLTVIDFGAAYPLTIDPTAQQAYLKASNTQTQDRFGYSIAASGDTVVVGARNEDGGAVGINGDGADNSANNAGAAYVYVRNGGRWIQQAYLKASNTGAMDEFGIAVAIDGDTIAVGAYREDSGSPGVNGDQSNNSVSNSGAVYVFVRNGTEWTQQAYLKASNPGVNDGYAFRVAISGETIVVGAFAEDSSATGVNGSQGNGSNNSGAAYVFVRNGTTWSQQAYLKASNTGSGDDFGLGVAIGGDTIAIGAPGESSNATGVNGNQMNNGASSSGAVYVFVRNGTTWSQQAYIKASNTGAGDDFGYSLAIEGNTLAVGAHREDGGSTGVDGDQSSNSAMDSGAVYLFERIGANWSQTAYLKASNAGLDDLFGESIAMSGNLVAVGAPREASNSSGIGGDQNDNSASLAGAAYLFMRTGSTWYQHSYVKASNPGAADEFGHVISISGDTLAVGAPYEDSNAIGVDGSQDDDSAAYAGAAYTFFIDTCPSDLNGNGVVDGADLAIILGAWGSCPRCPVDLTGDDFVDPADIALLLRAWGACN